MHGILCGNDVNISGPCDGFIDLESKQDMIMTMDNTKCDIGIVLCRDCGRSKGTERFNGPCRSLHDTMYAANNTKQCNICKQKLCNRCRYLDAYIKCIKCDNSLCKKCKEDSYECTMCDNLVCNKCNDGNNDISEWIRECTHCGDVLCKDCMLCCEDLTQESENQWFYEID